MKESRLAKITKEEFQIQLDDNGSWIIPQLALDPTPIDSGAFWMSDTFALYIEADPFNHYRAEFCPSIQRWQDIFDEAYNATYFR